MQFSDFFQDSLVPQWSQFYVHLSELNDLCRRIHISSGGNPSDTLATTTYNRLTPEQSGISPSSGTTSPNVYDLTPNTAGLIHDDFYHSPFYADDDIPLHHHDFVRQVLADTTTTGDGLSSQHTDRNAVFETPHKSPNQNTQYNTFSSSHLCDKLYDSAVTDPSPLHNDDDHDHLIHVPHENIDNEDVFPKQQSFRICGVVEAAASHHSKTSSRHRQQQQQHQEEQQQHHPQQQQQQQQRPELNKQHTTSLLSQAASLDSIMPRVQKLLVLYAALFCSDVELTDTFFLSTFHVLQQEIVHLIRLCVYYHQHMAHRHLSLIGKGWKWGDSPAKVITAAAAHHNPDEIDDGDDDDNDDNDDQNFHKHVSSLLLNDSGDGAGSLHTPQSNTTPHQHSRAPQHTISHRTVPTGNDNAMQYAPAVPTTTNPQSSQSPSHSNSFLEIDDPLAIGMDHRIAYERHLDALRSLHGLYQRFLLDMTTHFAPLYDPDGLPEHIHVYLLPFRINPQHCHHTDSQNQQQQQQQPQEQRHVPSSSNRRRFGTDNSVPWNSPVVDWNTSIMGSEHFFPCPTCPPPPPNPQAFLPTSLPTQTPQQPQQAQPQQQQQQQQQQQRIDAWDNFQRTKHFFHQNQQDSYQEQAQSIYTEHGTLQSSHQHHQHTSTTNQHPAAANHYHQDSATDDILPYLPDLTPNEDKMMSQHKLEKLDGQFRELTRCFHLLLSYSQTNTTALTESVLMLHNTACRVDLTPTCSSKIRHSYLKRYGVRYPRHVFNFLIELYAITFGMNDKHVIWKVLKSQPVGNLAKKTFSTITFVSSWSIVIFSALMVYYLYVHHADNFASFFLNIFPLWRFFVFFDTFLLSLGMMLHACMHYGINYIFLLQLEPLTAYSPRTVLAHGSIFTALTALSLLLSSLSHLLHFSSLTFVPHLCLSLLFLAYMVFNRRYLLFLARNVILCQPTFYVSWAADAMTSLTRMSVDFLHVWIFYIFCFIAMLPGGWSWIGVELSRHHHAKILDQQQPIAGFFSFVSPFFHEEQALALQESCRASVHRHIWIVTVFPFILRLFQCIRSYFDKNTFNPRHLGNAGKYFVAVVMSTFALLYKRALAFESDVIVPESISTSEIAIIIPKHDHLVDHVVDKTSKTALNSVLSQNQEMYSIWVTQLKLMFIGFAVCTTLYQLLWDFKMDWGWFEVGGAFPFRRNTILMQHKDADLVASSSSPVTSSPASTSPVLTPSASSLVYETRRSPQPNVSSIPLSSLTTSVPVSSPLTSSGLAPTPSSPAPNDDDDDADDDTKPLVSHISSPHSIRNVDFPTPPHHPTAAAAAAATRQHRAEQWLKHSFFCSFLPAAIAQQLIAYLVQLSLIQNLFHGSHRSQRLRFVRFVGYCAMTFNALARCVWIETIIPWHSVGLFSGDLSVLILGIVEIFRRMSWSLFRLENEQVNNHPEFRPMYITVPNINTQLLLAKEEKESTRLHSSCSDLDDDIVDNQQPLSSYQNQSLLSPVLSSPFASASQPPQLEKLPRILKTPKYTSESQTADDLFN